MYSLLVRFNNGAEIRAVHTWESAVAYIELCMERGDYLSHEITPIIGDKKPWWETMEGVALMAGLESLTSV